MRIIVPMIVGGIIGYITNWLAIKMLFRPHSEVRILGVKLPFTPGLIPKESTRIAKTIGDSVGENLLSPYIITNALSKPELNENIKLWIKDNIYKLRENHNSLKSVVMIQGVEKYKELLNYLQTNMVDFIFLKIYDEKFKNSVLDFVENLLYDKYGDEVQGFIFTQLDILLNDLWDSDKLKLEIDEKVISIINTVKSDERTLYEVIPESIISSISNYIDQEQDVIVKAIKDIIESPEIKNKLKLSLAEIVNKNVNKVITMFITPEQISEKVFSSLEKYIDSREVDGTIIYIIKNSIDKILNHKVGHLAGDGVAIISNGDTSVFTNIIMEYISNMENQQQIFQLLKDKMQSEELSIKSKLLTFLGDGIDSLVKLNEFREIISDIVDETLVVLLNKPVSSIFLAIDESKIESITEFMNIGFQNLVDTHLPSIITTMNISGIVEDQINSFDVEYTEKLILDIAKKELSAITWLGALLGIIMGLLTPLIQILY